MEDIERLIEDLKESLERDLAGVEGRLGHKIDDLKQSFDTQSVRVERHGGLIQAGSRWSTRMTRWSESVDAALAAQDPEIADHRERIARLERKSA